MVLHWFRKPAGEIPCRFESYTLRIDKYRWKYPKKHGIIRVWIIK